MEITEFIYHHKITLLVVLLLGIGCVFVGYTLFTEEQKNELTEISDSTEIEEQKEEEILPKELELTETQKEMISVDIKGAIEKPGVYQVPKDTRIHEGIDLAGGLTETAYTGNLNLSKKMHDEMVIYIYTLKEYQKKITCIPKNDYEGEITQEILEKESITEKKESSSLNFPISINEAKMEDLLEIDGIGKSKAENIIQYRETNGPFKNLEELKEVSGIGEAIYEKIKDRLVL
ncbi:MAG: hypothetical protein HFH86_00715 [Bacilli bacterium]|jgi:competence protein ComEA|nr:hypothetical protein [Bacilli bacterium]